MSTMVPPLRGPTLSREAAGSLRWVPLALALGLTTLAVALRLPGFGQSLFGDELFAASEVLDRDFTGMLTAINHSPEVTPPLYFGLAWASAKLFSGLDALRVPSIVLGTAAVPLAFLVGRRLRGTSAGFLGALFLALSPFAIFYSDEARPYAAIAFLGCLSLFALLMAVDHGGVMWWGAFALAIAASMYTHYTTVFVVIALLGWAVWAHPACRRQVGIAAGAAVILYIPWVPQIGDKNQLAIYGPVDLANLPRTGLQVFPGHPFAAPAILPGSIALAVLAAATVISIGWLVWNSGLRLPGRRDGSLVLLALLTLATPVGLVAYSVASGHNLLLPRNWSASLPGLVLLLGALLTAPPRWLAVPLSLLAVAAVATGTVKALGSSYQRPPTHEAARVIDVRGPSDAPVIDLQYVPATNPTARALRLYLSASHPAVDLRRRGIAWRMALARNLPVFVTWTEASQIGSLAPFSAPPVRYRRRFALVFERRLPGIFPVFIREYRPRR